MTRVRVDPLAWLDAREQQRRSAGLRRQLRPRPVDGDGLLDLASNDYLGLARDARVVAGATEALAGWGAGATGSRLVTGTTQLHADLEAELAAFAGPEAALVFSTGYLANLGAVAALAGPGDLIVSDALNHASIVDACRLSRARVVVTPHNDAEAVAAALRERQEERAVVVTDAVFSVDGDLAPLPALATACREYAATLVVDEAHGLGVVGEGGRGAVYDAGLAGEPDVVVTATLSKSLGSQGGAVLASERVVAHLVDSARSFIFDTGLAPSAAGAARAALGVLVDHPELAAGARMRAQQIARAARSLGLAASDPRGAVVSVLMGSPQEAVEAAEICAARGVRVGCFRPPSVPDGVSRLRLTARADLSDADLATVEHALSAVAER